MRIVSVLPSATEIVCALGQRASLVGRSEECDFPPSVRELPVVMRARTLDADRPSGEIDARVRDAMARGESLYTLDVELLARLRPDVLLTQDLCRVCSVTDDEAVAACERAGVSPHIVSLSPTRLLDVWASIERVGHAIGAGERAEGLAVELRARTPSPSVDRERPRVAVIEWLDPPIEAGLWTPDLLASAGGTGWSSRSGAPARRLSWETLRRDPPDFTILSPCAFTVDRTVRDLEASDLGRMLADWPVPGGVWIADESYFSRPGPRLALGRELVFALLHGEAPPAGAMVRAWSGSAGGMAA